MAKSCDEWWMIYCDVWDNVLVIGITTCMAMSMTTGRSHRSCLYYFAWPACHWITPCNLLYFVAKRLAIEVEVIVGVTTSWRHNDGDHDDGDHGVMPVTKMIMVPRRWRSKEHDDIGHIMSLFDCMWCLSCFASYLLRTTVVSKMIPYDNFKKVFPLTVHRCEGSLFRSTTWWSGVIDSNVRIHRV